MAACLPLQIQCHGGHCSRAPGRRHLMHHIDIAWGCLQICVRWNLQLGHSVIPKSVTDSRIVENLQVVKFEIPKAQMDELNAISHQMRMLDGAFVCGPNTPYATIEDLWDGEVRPCAIKSFCSPQAFQMCSISALLRNLKVRPLKRNDCFQCLLCAAPCISLACIACDKPTSCCLQWRRKARSGWACNSLAVVGS